MFSRYERFLFWLGLPLGAACGAGCVILFLVYMIWEADPPIPRGIFIPYVDPRLIFDATIIEGEKFFQEHRVFIVLFTVGMTAGGAVLTAMIFPLIHHVMNRFRSWLHES